MDGVDGDAEKRLGVVDVDTEGVVVTVVVVVVVVTAVVVVCGVRGEGVAFCRRRKSARRCFSASEALKASKRPIIDLKLREQF